MSDSAIAKALHCSKSRWRGHLAGYWPITYEEAAMVAYLIDIPLDALWWRAERVNVPEEMRAHLASQRPVRRRNGRCARAAALAS